MTKRQNETCASYKFNALTINFHYGAQMFAVKFDPGPILAVHSGSARSSGNKNLN